MKIKNKKISVVIPSYNHQAYVVNAIESVLTQDWPYIDLVVIDDGSTDRSPQILSDFYREKRGFRFISRPNKGLIKTLNEGLKIAEGEFFCLLASDDYLPPGSLSGRAAYLLANPDCVAVFGDALQLTGDKVSGQRVMDAKRRRLFELADPIPEFIKGVNLPIHTLMARTELFKNIGGFDVRYQYCEDLDPQLLLYLAGPIKFVDVPVYCLRQHQTNSSRTNPHVARADKVLLYRKYLEEIPQLAPYKKLIRHQLTRQYLLLGRYLNKTSTPPSNLEKKLFAGAVEYSWRDIRLLWHLLLLRIRGIID
ncbi:MAG: glycosyltransferase [Desulfobulbaceae bacterium]|nr:glycosyltransferase [Desulfobulbaceae bacterium]